MTQSEKKIFKKVLFSLLMLLLVRLVFFLQDDTNDTVELILRWVIFAGSLGIILLYVYYSIDSVREFFIN